MVSSRALQMRPPLLEPTTSLCHRELFVPQAASPRQKVIETIVGSLEEPALHYQTTDRNA